MAHPWTHIFTDLGKMVKSAWLLRDVDDALDGIKTEVDGQFDDDADDVAFAALAIKILAPLVDMAPPPEPERESVETPE